MEDQSYAKTPPSAVAQLQELYDVTSPSFNWAERQPPFDIECLEEVEDSTYCSDASLGNYVVNTTSADNQLLLKPPVEFEPSAKELDKACGSSRKIVAIQNWYKKLEAFWRWTLVHGHGNVPQKDKELGVWVNTQRRAKRALDMSKPCPLALTKGQVAILDAVGFVWAKPNWEERFKELQAFRELHGHCLVPTRKGALGRWVTYQRSEGSKFLDFKNQGKMTPERFAALDELGFVWDVATFQKLGKSSMFTTYSSQLAGS